MEVLAVVLSRKEVPSVEILRATGLEGREGAICSASFGISLVASLGVSLGVSLGIVSVDFVMVESV